MSKVKDVIAAAVADAKADFENIAKQQVVLVKGEVHKERGPVSAGQRAAIARDAVDAVAAELRAAAIDEVLAAL